MSMLKNTLFKKIVPVCLLVLPMAVLAKAQEAMEELTILLQNTHTFSADFEQNIKDKKGATISESSGKVKISRPGKFYWKIEHPEPVLVVADGKVLWHYDMELDQVTKKDLNKALANSPAALLAGSTDALKKNFKANYTEIKKCKIDNDTCITLKSTEADPLFNEIKIAFRDKKLTAMEMTDALGQTIWTQYNSVTLNGAVDKSLFHFTPPKGTDIIHSNQ